MKRAWDGGRCIALTGAPIRAFLAVIAVLGFAACKAPPPPPPGNVLLVRTSAPEAFTVCRQWVEQEAGSVQKLQAVDDEGLELRCWPMPVGPNFVQTLTIRVAPDADRPQTTRITVDAPLHENPVRAPPNPSEGPDPTKADEALVAHWVVEQLRRSQAFAGRVVDS